MFGPNWSEIADLEVWHVSLSDHLVEVCMKYVLMVTVGLPAFTAITKFSEGARSRGEMSDPSDLWLNMGISTAYKCIENE